MRTLLSCLIASIATAGALAGPELEYRFETIKSKVVVEHAGDRRRAGVGDIAVGGDLVRTGWFAHASLAVNQAASRFELYPSTRVRLGDERPEVLVILERGKLEAVFDALTGRDDRLVATPGAVLAVRGTRYGVEVDGEGEAVLAVFEGRVEVRPTRTELQAVTVEAGHLCRFGPRTAPRVARAPQGLDERSWQRGGAMRDLPEALASPGDRQPVGQPGTPPGGKQPHGHGKGGDF
jgi:hypothetical protein